MKTQYLFGLFLFVLTLTFSRAGAQTTYTWTGASSKLWSVAGNWSPSGHPGAADNVKITLAGPNPTVDVTSQCATLDFSGAGLITLTLAANLTVNNTLTIQTTNKVAIAAGTGFTLKVNGLTTLFGNNNLTIDASNTAYFNSMVIDSGSTSATPAGTTLINKGTTQITGTITMNPAPAAPNNSQINNNGGTFYAGISGTPCTINMSDNAIINNAGSGSFYLGPTSVINLTGATASVNNNAGTFTIQSDATGSGTIGAITGSGARFTGSFDVQRYITGGTGYRGYRLLSSPVYSGAKLGNNVYSINYLITSCYVTGTTGTTGGFDNTGAGNPSIYIYRENLAPSNSSFISGNFRGINDITASPKYTLDADGPGYYIPVGNGFLFFFRGDRSVATFAAETTTTYVPTSTTLTATGKLNQGPDTLSMWFSHTSTNLGWSTGTSNAAIRGYNLVGNPYASSIDWDTYSSTSSTAAIYAPGTNAFIYVLDGKSKNYNVYKAGFGGVGTIAATNSNIIPSGQGFFVRATKNVCGLIFNESCKTNTQATKAAGNLFLGHPPVANSNRYLHLSLMADTDLLDGALINFSKNATGMYDPNTDAMYHRGNGPGNLSSFSEDSVKLAFNNVPLPRKSPKGIRLNVNAAADGAYQLNLDRLENIPKLFDIFLMDEYLKDSTDLRQNPAYRFNITISDTNSYHANRFKLVIRQNKSRMVHLLNFGANKNTDWSQVVWQTENEEDYTYFTVERSTDGGNTYNVLGSSPSQAQGTYSFADKTPVAGANLYRLKIEDINGDITYSSVVTIVYGSQATAAISNISVYPNPAGDMLNLAVNPASVIGTDGLAISPKANAQTYEIKIFSITGAVIKSVTSSAATWQDNVSTLTPGTYMVQVIKSSDKTLVGKSTFVKL